MRKEIILFTILIFFIGIIFVGAQQEKDLETGPGTEVIKVGGVKVLAPKGAKVRQEQGRIIVEDLAEYVGRRFEQMDKRLLELEKKQSELEKKIEELKLAVSSK